MAYVWTPGVGYEWDAGVGQAPAQFTPAGAPTGMGSIGAAGQYGIAAQAALGPQYLQRPGAERYVQSIENPLLGSYYLTSPYTAGVGEQAGEYATTYGSYLGGPGAPVSGQGTAVPPLPGSSLIRSAGGVQAQRDAGASNFGTLIAVARGLQEGSDVSALDPTGRYQDILGSSQAVSSIGSLAAYDPNFGGPAGQMRQAAIQRRMAPWAARNPFVDQGGVATEGDWLSYLAEVLPGSYNIQRT